MQNTINDTEKQLFSEKKINTAQTILKASPVKNKNVFIDFCEDKLSTDTGALLLKELEQHIGIIAGLDSVINDNRNQSYVEHTHKEMLTQRIFQIAAGYEDAIDCNTLRNDPVFKMCLGKLPETDPALASQPTMTRFENSIGIKTAYKLAQVFFDSFIKSYTEEPEIIVIDADDTDYTGHGHQEGLFYNDYYGENCYMPLMIFEGLSGKLITSILKPGRRLKTGSFTSIVKRIIQQIRQHWKSTIIVFRGDSHFCSPELMQLIDNESDIYYVTGLTGNSKLYKMVDGKLNEAKERYDKNKNLKKTETVKLYHTFYYQAGTWESAKRVVAKIEYGEKGKNIRFVVSNFENVKATALYEEIYCKRGEMELFIKNHKTYLKSSRTSCHSFYANQFRVFLHSAAYVLLHSLQKEVLKGTEFAHCTMQTLQLKLLKIASRVKEMKTKINLFLPLSYPYNNIFTKALKMFTVLRN
jgi:hypothetical protein